MVAAVLALLWAPFSPLARTATAGEIGGQIFSTGAAVEVQILPASAGFTSEIWLFAPDGRLIGTNRQAGRVVALGSFPKAVELVFGIFVRNTGRTFKTGPGDRNPDGIPHAMTDLLGAGRIRVGFEDLFGGGDRDYNDVLFEVRGGVDTVPPPLGPPDEVASSFGSDPTVGVLIAEPVNTLTGNLTLQAVDLRLPGRGPPLRLARTYNARDTSEGVLGVGWSTELSWRVSERPGGEVALTRGDGRRDVHARLADGTYAAPPGVFDVLTRAADDWTLRTPDQLTIGFDASGAVREMRDRNGNTLELETDAEGLVTRMLASGGRSISLVYAGDRLIGATDSAGRSVSYEYADAHLVAVTDPSGAVTRYGYDDVGLLETITDPLENVVLTNRYDADGRVVEQRDALGVATTFVYGADQVTTTTGPRGAVTTIAHDAAGRAVTLTDATGAVVRYAYDTRGNLTGFTDRNGNAWTFSHDANGNRTGVSDPAGASASFTYDARNDLLSRTDPLGNTWSYGYDDRGDLTRVTDPGGGLTTIGVDAFGLPTRITDGDGVAVEYAYDETGNVVSVSTAAGVARTEYDNAGRPVLRTDANGRATAFAYDPLGRLVAVTDALGATSRLAYDAAGNHVETTDRRGSRTAFEHDAAGRLVRVTDALGGITSFAYDAAGNRTRIVDPTGAVTAFDYDALERLAAVEDAEGGVSRFAYDANGNLIEATDPRGGVARSQFDFRNQRERAVDRSGAVTAFAYDAAGRLVGTTDPSGAATTFAYDAAGRAISTTDALAGVTTAVYTPAGRLAAQIDPRGGATDFLYDAAGRLSSVVDAVGNVVEHAYDAVGNRTARTDPPGRVTAYAHDELDRLVAVTDPTGAVTRFAYDAEGALGVVTDPVGAETCFAYDALGRLVRVTDALGGTTEYELDPRGVLTRAVDANGHARSYVHDRARRLVRESDPLGRARTYAYDPTGNLAALTDAKGQTTRYAYDAGDRLVEISRADGELVRYELDARGLRSRMTDGRGTTTYAYDELRRLVSVAGPDGGEIGYAYDENGNRTALVDPLGRTATYEYDALDRIVEVGFAGGTTTYSYNAAGDLTAAAFANGSSLAASYDAASRPTELGYLGADGRDAAVLRYVYDAAGRIVRETTTGSRNLDADRVYVYDALSRLVEARDERGGPSETYRYDAVGNRTAVERLGGHAELATFDAADQLIALVRQRSRRESADETTFRYDTNGNLIARRRAGALIAYGYDAADRLVSVADAQGETRFAYDGDGALVREERWLPGGTSPRSALEHTLDVAGPLTQILTTSDGSRSAAYLYGHGRIAAFVDGEGTFFAQDVRGTPVLEADDRGDVSDVSAFDPWGIALPSSGDANEGGAAGSSVLDELFGFTGERHDARSGLVHLRARWYDPSLGRFLTRDPFAGVRTDPRTQHPYVYALNSPTNLADRTGRSASSLFETPGGGGGGGGFGGLGGFGEAAERPQPSYSLRSKFFATSPFAAPPPLTPGGAGCSAAAFPVMFAFCPVDARPPAIVDRDPGVHGPTTLITTVPPTIPQVRDLPVEPQGSAIAITPLPEPDPASRVLKALDEQGGDQAAKEIWRIYGGKAELLGRSWTPVDPGSLSDPRGSLGLPDVNTGESVARGRVTDWEGITCRRALPCDGNPGGEIEYVIPEPSSQVEISETIRLKEPY